MAPRGFSNVDWKEGDIAFLKSYQSFRPKDYNDLIGSGYIEEKATMHPVIILAIENHKAIITIVSSHSTDRHNRAPWHMGTSAHLGWNQDDFRAFEGTRRPNERHPFLRLADPKMRMPKPKASWVLIQNFYCVPFSVLGNFNNAPDLLRVHPESLVHLKTDMKARFPAKYYDAGARLNCMPARRRQTGLNHRPRAPGPAPAPAPAPAPCPSLTQTSTSSKDVKTPSAAAPSSPVSELAHTMTAKSRLRPFHSRLVPLGAR